MAHTRRSTKAFLSPTKKLTGPKKIQKHKSTKSTPKVSAPVTKRLTNPNTGNHRKDLQDPELAMMTDIALQSSPIPPASLNQNVKEEKKLLKAASDKKNNVTSAEKHNDAEKQVIDCSALKTHKRNSDLVDYTIIADGSTRSTEKPLRSPVTVLSSRRLPKPSKYTTRVKGRGHVTNKTRRISPRVHIDKILLSYMPVEDLWLGYAIELFSDSLKINRRIEQGLMTQQTWGDVQEKDKAQRSLDECIIELQKQRGVLREGIAHLNNYKAIDENVSQQMEDVV